MDVESAVRVAVDEERFSCPFPFESHSDCVDRISEEGIDDPDAFCNAWKHECEGSSGGAIMETRGFLCERRDESNDALRVSGRAVVFDSLSEDLGGFREKFARGSLDKTLAERRDVGLLYSHDSGSVLASTRAGNLTLTVDEAGLRVDAELDRSDPDVQRLDAKLRAGTVDRMSFGFRALNDRWDERDTDGTPIRTVTEAQLIETSAVWLPAYPATSLEGRGRLADLPVGALATMPESLRDELVGELREGKVLSKANKQALEAAKKYLEDVLKAAGEEPTDAVDAEDDTDDEPLETVLGRARHLERLVRA